MTSNAVTRHQYLKDHGQQLIDNGYWIHPVRPLKKVPDEDEWQKVRATASELKGWLDGKHLNSGVSVILGNVLAIDIDVRDSELSDAMVEYVTDLLGAAPLRIGQAPKCAIIVRPDVENIRKTKSAVMESWDGGLHHVEVLATGQQIVAYNIHPDTRNPYLWPGADLVSTPVDDLPSCGIEEIEAILAEFERLAADEYGMEVKRKSGQAGLLSEEDQDALFLENLALRGRSRDDLDALRETLAFLAERGYADDHDLWFTIGMALHYEFQGEVEGFEIWTEFSQLAEQADVGGFERWDSFGEETYGAKPATLGTVYAWAKEERLKVSGELLEQIIEVVESSVDVSALESRVNDDVSRLLPDLSVVSRRKLEDVVQTKFKDLGVKLSKPDIKKMLKPRIESVKLNETQAEKLLKTEFSFLQGWAWSVQDDSFIHLNYGKHSQVSFRARFEREFLRIPDHDVARFVDPEGRYAQRCFDPVWFSHNILQLPHVAGTMYAPGFPSIFKSDDDREYFNQFRSWLSRLPSAYDWEWTSEQTDAVERFKQTMEYACGGAEYSKETALVLSWIASRYQRPEKKHRWALFFWGPKGSGKSSVGDYLARIFGSDAVNQVSPAEIESQFNGYSGGAVINVVDEIDVSTRKNKQQIVTSIRADITQDRVSRICKGADAVNVFNFTDYIFLSNEPDGIPIDEGERRYMVLSSLFKTRQEARQGMVVSGFRDQVERDLNNPDALAAIRGFLESYEIHPEFNSSDAPETDAKRASTETGRSVIQLELMDIIEDEQCWFATPTAVSVAHVHRELVRRQRAGLSPDVDPSIKRNVLGRVLSSEPFNMHLTSRFRLDGDRVVVKHSGGFDPDEFKEQAEAADDWDG